MSTSTSRGLIFYEYAVRHDVMLQAIFLDFVLVSQDGITRQATLPSILCARMSFP